MSKIRRRSKKNKNIIPYVIIGTILGTSGLLSGLYYYNKPLKEKNNKIFDFLFLNNDGYNCSIISVLHILFNDEIFIQYINNYEGDNDLVNFLKNLKLKTSTDTEDIQRLDEIISTKNKRKSKNIDEVVKDICNKIDDFVLISNDYLQSSSIFINDVQIEEIEEIYNLYDLFGIIFQVSSGHYFPVVKKNEIWYKYDESEDSYITEKIDSIDTINHNIKLINNFLYIYFLRNIHFLAIYYV
jgi:hypothetical protein